MLPPERLIGQILPITTPFLASSTRRAGLREQR